MEINSQASNTRNLLNGLHLAVLSNHGAQRQANNALWTIAMVRMRSEARAREYVVKRTGDGLSKKEIHRCLKRYIVRELYPLILADLADSGGSA